MISFIILWRAALISGLVWLVAARSGAASQASLVSVTVHQEQPRQVIEGFGATMLSTLQGAEESVSDPLKRLAADAVLRAASTPRR